MRFRLTILTASLAAALAVPGAAQATKGAVAAGAPCLDAKVVTVACPGPAAPAATPPAAACGDGSIVPGPANLAAVRATTVCLVNRERTQRGLRPLQAVPALEGAAAGYATRMVRERFFDHTAPDGKTFVTRIKRTSYLRGALRRWSVGENLAWGSGALATPDAIVKAWMASPGHRANILNGAFTELGIAVAPGAPSAGVGNGAATYVNEFGLRQR